MTKKEWLENNGFELCKMSNRAYEKEVDYNYAIGICLDSRFGDYVFVKKYGDLRNVYIERDIKKLNSCLRKANRYLRRMEKEVNASIKSS